MIRKLNKEISYAESKSTDSGFDGKCSHDGLCYLTPLFNGSEVNSPSDPQMVSGPTTPLDFLYLRDTYRLQAPSGWTAVAETADVSSLISGDNSVNVRIARMTPNDAIFDIFDDADIIIAPNGNRIVVGNQIVVNPMRTGESSVFTMNGVDFSADDATIVLVSMNSKAYFVNVIPASGTTLDETVLAQVVDKLSTLEKVPAP